MGHHLSFDPESNCLVHVPSDDALANRYQHQPWYVQLWRRRWYLLIPIWTIDKWMLTWQDGERVSLADAYSWAKGWTHYKMRWWYSMEEVQDIWEVE